jgi:hypothetical protein
VVIIGTAPFTNFNLDDKLIVIYRDFILRIICIDETDLERNRKLYQDNFPAPRQILNALPNNGGIVYCLLQPDNFSIDPKVYGSKFIPTYQI